MTEITLRSRACIFRRIGAGTVLLAATASCATSSTLATREAAGDVAAARWTATLTPQTSPPIGGSATLSPASDSNQMVVTLSIDGSPSSSAAMPWRVVTGSCNVSAGTIVGSSADYLPIQMEADGTGRATATIPIDPEVGGVYSVRVYGPPPGPERVVACGDLQSVDG